MISNDEAGLAIWTDSYSNNSWILAGKDGNDISAGCVLKNGFDRLGGFALAGSGK